MKGGVLMKLISVIAPMYNEELLVSEYCDITLNVLRSIEAYQHELILVNDGSSDSTYSKMIETQLKFPNEIGVVCLTRNFGLEGAVSAGLRVAKGDVVVVMDADLQDPPELMRDMLVRLEAGADIVVASRVKRSNDSTWKKVSANLYYKLLDGLSGKLKLEKSAANYRMLTRRALDKWLELPETNGVFRVTVPYIGMKVSTVQYDRNKRVAGKTKYRFKSMLKYALDSLTGISIEPLTGIMLTVPICAGIVLLSIIGAVVFKGYWRMGCVVMSVLGFLFLLLFICITTLGIYIGQVMLEVKHRPISIIYEYKPAQNIEEK